MIIFGGAKIDSSGGAETSFLLTVVLQNTLTA